jgi:hypothetical protein
MQSTVSMRVDKGALKPRVPAFAGTTVFVVSDYMAQ